MYSYVNQFIGLSPFFSRAWIEYKRFLCPHTLHKFFYSPCVCSVPVVWAFSIRKGKSITRFAPYIWKYFSCFQRFHMCSVYLLTWLPLFHLCSFYSILQSFYVCEEQKEGRQEDFMPLAILIFLTVVSLRRHYLQTLRLASADSLQMCLGISFDLKTIYSPAHITYRLILKTFHSINV